MSTPWTPFAETGQTVIGLPGSPEGIIWANNRYQVVVRHCGEDPVTGPLIWLSIKSLDDHLRHDWREFQRIKVRRAT